MMKDTNGMKSYYWILEENENSIKNILLDELHKDPANLEELLFNFKDSLLMKEQVYKNHDIIKEQIKTEKEKIKKASNIIKQLEEKEMSLIVSMGNESINYVNSSQHKGV